jgi:glycosidase
LRLYEINTRVHCTSFDQITQAELADLAALGFDAVWLMGVWEISEGVRRLSKITADDFEGSPYAIPRYKFNSALGGKKRFTALVERAHKAGLAVIVDFVSNHMAIDSPWIKSAPDWFIRSNSKVRAQITIDYFLHPSGEVVAFGRDPFFPPWTDTSQLDYTNLKLRKQMIDTLLWISKYADGVRCDMAMLVLKDYIYRQWYPFAPAEWFDERMPGEFWDEAIGAVRKVRPDFKFIAEAYWDKEQRLHELGFDLSYEKKLYDALVARNAQYVYDRLARGSEALRSSIYFIENHDEPRAAFVFNRKDNLTAAALILALPASVLIHEGQMEGRQEKLPVQRLKPLVDEPPDLELREAYEQILTVTAQDVFRDGTFQLFDSGVWGAVTFMRQNAEHTVAYLGQVSEAWHKFHSTAFDLSPLAQAINASDQIEVTNLITANSIRLQRQDGAFKLQPEQIGVGEGTEFCYLEVKTV